jgi:hypothetical protein
MMSLSLLGAGCATAPLDHAGTLQSYDNLTASDGLFTNSLIRVNTDNVLAAKTVRIVPTVFSVSAQRPALTPVQRALVSNAADRALCVGLSERFQVVSQSEPADLTVHAVITHVTPTDPVAAGLSKGAAVATSVALPTVPIPVPRIPVGLGSLSLEAEARDAKGGAKAAMIWGRGANAFIGAPRVAEEGDAYTLAAQFGADFSELLVTGTTPFGTLLSPPSMEKLTAALGASPKYPACEVFGRSPGLLGVIGESVGAPPDWTDNGAASPQ